MASIDDAEDVISEDLTDLAYEAMTNELEYWRIIGPDKQNAFIAIRDPEIVMKMKATAIIMPDASTDVARQNAAAKNFRLKDKQHAVACLQWHALRAALAAVKRELVLSTSEQAANDTSDAPIPAANMKEEQ